MFIAVYINTFHGAFEPHGMFQTKEQAERWIEETGRKIFGRNDPELWATFEVQAVT